MLAFDVPLNSNSFYPLAVAKIFDSSGKFCLSLSGLVFKTDIKEIILVTNRYWVLVIFQMAVQRPY